MNDISMLYNELSNESQKIVRETLESYYGPLGSFDCWTMNQVYSLLDIGGDDNLLDILTTLVEFK